MVIILYLAVIGVYLAANFISKSHYRKRKYPGRSGPFMRISAWLYEMKGQKSETATGRNKGLQEDLAVLHPDGTKESEDQYYIKKGAYILGILFVADVAALCLYVTGCYYADGLIRLEVERGNYGESSRKEKLSAVVDTEQGSMQEDVTVTVMSRQYSKEEAMQWIDAAIDKLPELILGENDTFDHVTKDMDLVQEIPDMPVSIEWTSGDYGLLDYRGRIMCTELPQEGSICMLTAKVSCEEYQKECSLYVCLYPEAISYAGLIQRDLEEALRKAEENSRTEKTLQLPQEVNGKKVVWKGKSEDYSTKIWIIAIIMAIAVWFAMDKDVHKKVEQREQQMRRDYPEVVSKLVLLMGAGMTIRTAVHRVASQSREHPQKAVYEQLARICHEMDSGVSEGVAYLNLGKRCRDPHYVRLSMLLSQNLRKGNAGLTGLLEKEAEQAFEERKRNARKYGEEAATKLLAPMFIMLVIVMVVIMVPAFFSFGN